MKIILRDALTRLYYGGDQTWSAVVSEAMEFDCVRTAASAAQERKLNTVHIVLRYEEPMCELALPLEPYLFEMADHAIKGQETPYPD